MCGIAGKVLFNSKKVTKSDLKKMSLAIAHRGPDDEGFFISPNKKIGLVNRRLAIVDLSARGHQPMSFKSKYIITFNGEVYNFNEQRERLKKYGYKFRSRTDTEVILALYDKYGISFLKYLRGMFALAIYDKAKKEIFLARDRIGKKPLKYYFKNDTFVFASELKAILTQKEVKREPDFLAIHNYLTYGYVPSPLTGFVGIKKLPPGHYMILDLKNKKLKIKSYWQPDLTQKLNLSENEWVDKLLTEIKTATSLRMVADVPVGAFLSGGVDSSGIVASMALQSPDPIKTFTVVFKEKRYNERKEAKKVAKLYKTDHEEIKVIPKSIEMLPMLAHQYEEPFADASAVITYMVSNIARKYVTVVLNGDGGDENFAGYDRHKRIVRDAFVDNFNYLKPYAAGSISLIQKFIRHATLERMQKFFKKSSLPISARYVSYNRYLSKKDKRAIYQNYFKELTNNYDANVIAEESFKNSAAGDPRDQGLFFDLTKYLPEDLLAKVDIASMANSLEARSPLLDQNVIDLAGKIPYGLKVKGGETKYILKKAFESIVPKENLYRPKKGFSVPLDMWFAGDLNKYTKSKLLRKNAKTKDLFKAEEIRKMLDSHSVANDFGPRLWSLLTLELWFESYFA